MFKGQTSNLVSPLLTSGNRMAPPSGQASVSSSRNCSLQSLRAPSIWAPKAPVPRAPGTFLMWGVPAAPHSPSSMVPSVHTTPHSWKGGGRLAGRSDALAPGEWASCPWMKAAGQQCYTSLEPWARKGWVQGAVGMTYWDSQPPRVPHSCGARTGALFLGQHLPDFCKRSNLPRNWDRRQAIWGPPCTPKVAGGRVLACVPLPIPDPTRPRAHLSRWFSPGICVQLSFI